MSKSAMRVALNAFNVRRGETVPLLFMLAHSFFLGMALVNFETAASALFLSKSNVSLIPYVYICAAAVVAAIGVLYSAVERRVSFASLLAGSLTSLLIMIVGLRISLSLSTGRWPTLLLLGAVEVLTILTGLVFWGLAGRLFHVRQGKRLFGLMGTGEVAAGVVGGLMIPLLVGSIGTANLLVVAAVCLSLALAVQIAILRRYGSTLASSTRQSRDEAPTRRVPQVEAARRRYIRLVLALAALSTCGYYLVDFLFYAHVEKRYVDEVQLASFFGLFGAVVGMINLVGGTLFSGRLIGRYGLLLGLCALPVAVGVGVIPLAATAAVSSNLTALFAWAVGTKLLDQVFRVCLHGPSARILYQPLPAGDRMRAQTLVEAIVEPAAAVVAGGALLLLTAVAKLGALELGLFTIAVLGAWIVAAVMVRRQYTTVLTGALLGHGGASELTLDDASSLQVLKKTLDSPRPGEVICALGMLEEMEHPSLPAFLVGLLSHPFDAVRHDVLCRMQRVEGFKDKGEIRRVLQTDSSNEVRSAALVTLCAMGTADVHEEVSVYLDDTRAEMRRSALVGLLRYGGIEGVLEAGESMLSLARSGVATDRALAAEILGEVGVRSFHRPLLALLRDPDKGVRRSALAAAGKLHNRKLWEAVVDNLRDPALRGAAVAALACGGAGAVPALEAAFDGGCRSPMLQRIIARTWGRQRCEEAVQALVRRFDYPDQEVRCQILESLVNCGYRAPESERAHVLEHIRTEVADAAWSREALMAVADSSLWLATALFAEVDRNVECVLRLLSFVCAREPILHAALQLKKGNRESQARAIEVLDNLIPAEIKGLVLPMFEDQDMTATINAKKKKLPAGVVPDNVRATIKAALDRSDEWSSSWTKACALHAVGSTRLLELKQEALRLLEAPSPIVRETALWALAQLDLNSALERSGPLSLDKDRRVVAMARSLSTASKRGAATTKESPHADD
jgi:HEAT repeat protein